MRFVRLFLPIALTPVLIACGSIEVAPGRLGDGGASLRRVTVKADADANTRMATAVDIVFLRNRTVARQLPPDALRWFGKRGQFGKRFPGALEIVSVELPPGHTVRSVPLPSDPCSVVSILAYANHIAEAGRARLDLTTATEAVVRLEADDVTLFNARRKRNGGLR